MAVALDVLHGDKYASLGFVLPTLTRQKCETANWMQIMQSI
jgi:hypothetical protein